MTIAKLDVDLILRLSSDSRSERWSYLQIGNPSTDYGDEWPEIANAQASFYRDCSRLFSRLDCPSESTDCLLLADALEASAREYRNPEVGN